MTQELHRSKAHEKLILVIFLELCETRKKLEKIKQEESLHFFLLAIVVPVLSLIKKASLNGCFWISFFTLRATVELVFFCGGP